MLLAAVLIDTGHAGLEHTEHAFDRVRRDQFLTLATSLFAFGVHCRLVLGELCA